MSEFKYGDMVQVWDSEDQKWEEPRFYLGSIPIPDGNIRHYTMNPDEDESNFDGIPIGWEYVRKPEPTPELTIEERLDRIEAALAKLQNS